MEECGNEVDCALFLSSMARKRTGVTPSQAEWLRAGAPWSVVKAHPNGRSVKVHVRCAKDATVRLRVSASALAASLRTSALGKRERPVVAEEQCTQESEGRSDRLQRRRMLRAASLGLPLEDVASE